MEKRPKHGRTPSSNLNPALLPPELAEAICPPGSCLPSSCRMPFPSPVVYRIPQLNSPRGAFPRFDTRRASRLANGSDHREFRILAVPDAVTSIPFPEPPIPARSSNPQGQRARNQNPGHNGCRRSIRNLNRTPIHPSHTPNGQGIRDHVIRTPKVRLARRTSAPGGTTTAKPLDPVIRTVVLISGPICSNTSENGHLERQQASRVVPRGDNHILALSLGRAQSEERLFSGENLLPSPTCCIFVTKTANALVETGRCHRSLRPPRCPGFPLLPETHPHPGRCNPVLRRITYPSPSRSTQVSQSDR